MPPVWFEPTISSGKGPQTYVLDCTATGTGDNYLLELFWIKYCIVRTNICDQHATTNAPDYASRTVIILRLSKTFRTISAISITPSVRNILDR
jgi:hypothetical protein